MTAPKHEVLTDRERAQRDAPALTERHVARLRALCDAERAARLTQWGTATPGCVLAESHTQSSVDSHAPTQGAGVTHMRAGGAL